MELISWIYLGLFLTGIFPGLYWWWQGRFIKASAGNYKVNKGVSIVIAARNASKELKSNLPTVLNQNYPSFEVVIVDDGSDDDTALWLNKLSYDHKILRVISYKKTGPGKKEALAHGIKEALNDIILVTDADCRPASKDWVSHMVGAMGADHQIAFGYGPYRKLGGFLNRFIRFDTATIAIQYLSAVGQGRPYMGVGRNMIYYKNVFTNSGGFESHKDIASGDDDLFIQGLSNDIIGTICIEPDSMVYSEPKKTWPSFIGQKSRHISTSVRYKWRDKLFLSVYPALHVLFYFFLCIMIFTQPYMGLACFMFRIAILIFGVRPMFIKLREGDVIPWVPLIDIIQVPYYFILSIYSLLRKKNKW